MRDQGDIAEWLQPYSELVAQLDDYRGALRRLIEELLKSAGIEYAQLESRTKTLESFGQKITRKGEQYENPLVDITDLVGLRVIVYFPKDVEAVGALVEREFDVDWANSFRQSTSHEPDRFGYRSDHYVIRIGDRGQYPEYAKFAKHRVEIQVRTVMQHAWAAVDHKMRYKESDLPTSLQRRLFRLSALLEVADDQFADLQVEHGKVSNAYRRSLAKGEYDVELDALSLTAYLDQTHIGDHWAEIAMKVGFLPPMTVPKAHAKALRERRVTRLMHVLRRTGVSDLQQFQETLDSFERKRRGTMKTVAEETAKRSAEVYAVGEDTLTIALLLSAGNLKLVDELHFSKVIRDAIKATIRHSKNGSSD